MENWQGEAKVVEKPLVGCFVVVFFVGVFWVFFFVVIGFVVFLLGKSKRISCQDKNIPFTVAIM